MKPWASLGAFNTVICVTWVGELPWALSSLRNEFQICICQVYKFVAHLPVKLCKIDHITCGHFVIYSSSVHVIFTSFAGQYHGINAHLQLIFPLFAIIFLDDEIHLFASNITNSSQKGEVSTHSMTSHLPF